MIIYEGDTRYQANYPVLWAAVNLHLRGQPDTSAPVLTTLQSGQLVHYIGNYVNAGGYRWFRVRAFRSGTSWWVGWAAAVNLSNGYMNLRPVGIWDPNGKLCGNGANVRIVKCTINTPVYSTYGVYQGTYKQVFIDRGCATYCVENNYWYPFPVLNQDISRQDVAYPGQENLFKPYLVCGKTQWHLAGGMFDGVPICFYREVWFLDSGIKSGVQYLKREN